MFQPQKAPSLYCVPTKLWQKKQSDSPLSAPTAVRQKERERGRERECYSFNSLNEKRIKVHETKCLMRSSRIKFLFHQLVSICSGRWTKWALRHRNTSKYLFRACLCVCESVRMHLHSMSSYKKKPPVRFVRVLLLLSAILNTTRKEKPQQQPAQLWRQ